MSLRHVPPFESRRRKELREELTARARAWLPEWRPREGSGDFGTALLEVAARLSSEVTQRLDQIPGKNFRGLLYWLGVRGRAGESARLPVVFSLTPGSDPVSAPAGTQLQASETDPPVTFETEHDLQIIPGALRTLIGANAASDAFSLPPSGILSLEPPQPSPDEWQVKTAAGPGAGRAQLTPALGLDQLPTLRHEPTQQQYRVIKAEGDIVSLEPSIGTIAGASDGGSAPTRGFAADERLTRVTVYEPFDTTQRNRQEHILYLGSSSLLNVKAAATIAIENGATLPAEIEWSYWGKIKGQSTVAWQKLTPAQTGGRLTLSKPEGDVEELEIAGKKSRWIRGVMTPPVAREPIQVTQLRFFVNCDMDPKRPCPPVGRASVAVEAMSNTTPLTLDTLFFPFGREPRAFDTFYVSSPEAFSKKNASVEICFEAADATADTYMAARVGVTGPAMVFAVGHDGFLYRIRADATSAAAKAIEETIDRLPPIRPPFADNGALTVVAPPVFVNATQPRLTAVTRGTDVFVAMTAGTEAWLWKQSDATGSRWFRLGPIRDGFTTEPGSGDAKPPSITMVRDGEDALRLFGVNQGRLYEASIALNAEIPEKLSWTRIFPAAATDETAWVSVVPTFSSSRRLLGATLDDGVIAVDESGTVFSGMPAASRALSMTAGVRGLTWSRVKSLESITAAIAPLAVRIADGSVVIVVQQKPDTLTAVTLGDKRKRNEVSATPAGTSLDWSVGARGELCVVFIQRSDDTSGVVAAWFPFASSGPLDAKVLYLSSSVDDLQGAPAITARRIVASGGKAVLLHAPFAADAFDHVPRTPEDVGDVLLVEEPETRASISDFVAVEGKQGKQRLVRAIAREPISLGDAGVVYQPNEPFGKGPFTRGFQYRARLRQVFDGQLSRSLLTLADRDQNAVEGQLIVLEHDQKYRIHRIESVDSSTDPWVITVGPWPETSKQLSRARTSVTVRYTYVFDEESLNVGLRPRIATRDVAPLAIEAMRTTGAYFRSAKPAPQRVLYESAATDAGAPFVIFSADWEALPDSAAPVLTISRLAGKFVAVVPPPPPQPSLSWEYWNGAAWLRIKGLIDQTDKLTHGGVVRFCVPSDLQPTDVAGRMNHWIRARLVDGDYGREKFTPDDDGALQRDTSGIVPPKFVGMYVNYSVCCASAPDFVLTTDGGGSRDQTEANRTNEAAVELFVPLAETIRRAASLTSSTPGSDRDVPSRAIYLGFDAVLKGGPISLLFLVDEGDHDGAFPLVVEVLREDRFETITAQDNTRGLNESGEVVFTLDAPPRLTSLFGEDRYWLRVRPNAQFNATKWRPRIRAAFLNATWAGAAETQRPEMLGSSDGSPGQRVTLARPPVLEKSLTLRVREPLGDEEKDDLRRTDPTMVIAELSGRPGPWVRWAKVVDPADEAPTARVYALDDQTGDITFGDGVHGMIPPIGRDVIMAERYKRGGGEAANAVGAWSQISLVSPIQGVQTVVAPDGAAGGSDPQPDDDVLRFAPANQLRRDRALTLRDLEVLAHQSVKDIAQVRARGTSAGVELVVVMRGRSPNPSQAVKRELLRQFARCTSPMLAEHGAVRIVPPDLVRIHIDLRLTIAAIEDSGSVHAEAALRIANLLDPANGGLDLEGWPLGVAPSETDVAAALIGTHPIDGLDEIDQIDVWNVGAEGVRERLGDRLTPTQLVQLVANGVAVEFTLSSAEVAV